MGVWTLLHDRPENVADLPGWWRPLHAPGNGAVVVAGRDEDGITTAVLRVEYASDEGSLDARWDVAYVLAYGLTGMVQRTREEQRRHLLTRPA